MKKDRIRGKFTVVNEVSVSRPSPRLLLFICIVLNCNPQRAFRLFRPSSWKFRKRSAISRTAAATCTILISDINLNLLNELHTYGSVRNLKDRRSDLYEVRVKK